MSSDTLHVSSAADRKSHVDLADAENRIDGLTRDSQTDAIFAAYVAGEISVTDIAVRLHALLGS
jgi:hypothetical protein